MFYMQGYELSWGVVGMLEGFCIVPVGPLLVWQPYLSPCSRGWSVPYPSTSSSRCEAEREVEGGDGNFACTFEPSVQGQGAGVGCICRACVAMCGLQSAADVYLYCTADVMDVNGEVYCTAAPIQYSPSNKVSA